jgi:hypothetical protein
MWFTPKLCGLIKLVILESDIRSFNALGTAEDKVLVVLVFVLTIILAELGLIVLADSTS